MYSHGEKPNLKLDFINTTELGWKTFVGKCGRKITWSELAESEGRRDDPRSRCGRHRVVKADGRIAQVRVGAGAPPPVGVRGVGGVCAEGRRLRRRGGGSGGGGGGGGGQR